MFSSVQLDRCVRATILTAGDTGVIVRCQDAALTTAPVADLTRSTVSQPRTQLLTAGVVVLTRVQC